MRSDCCEFKFIILFIFLVVSGGEECGLNEKDVVCLFELIYCVFFVGLFI